MKKVIFIFAISILLILPFKVSASELEKSFEKSFDELASKNAYLMSSYDDAGNIDGYIIYNESFLVKFDLNNRMLFNKKEFIPDDLVVTENSGDLIIKRVDSAGNTIWQDIYDNNSYKYLYQTLNSYDNTGNLDGYFIFVTILSQDFDNEPGFYIMKYSLNGKVLWTKPSLNNITSGTYTRNEDGDVLSYSNSVSHGLFACIIKNISQNTTVINLDIGRYWDPVYMIDKSGSPKLIIIYNDYNNNLQFGKYTLYGEKIFTKKLNISNNNFFTKPVNSITLDGEYDGFILGNSGDFGNLIIKFDYDGNIVWKSSLAYNPKSVIESYDQNGEFNGYIVLGYNENKTYITKFTYPKKVIDSKNSDVEVISDAYPGKVVTLTPKVKEGYIVKRVIVRDSSGKEIKVNSDNTFIMPDDDVSIEVVYEKKEVVINPETASTLSAVLTLISLIILGTILVRTKKLNYNK